MKQYTTPTITVTLNGQSAMLDAADRVVLSIKNKNTVRNFEGERLSINEDAVSVQLTTTEAGAMRGSNEVELTVFIDDQVHKSETMRMEIRESVWDNADD